jgi:hypothetical protein
MKTLKLWLARGLTALATAASITSLAIAADTTAVATEKPNILIIWGDDIGPFNISAYNNGIMGFKTPNIDRIAKEGIMLPTLTVIRAVPLDVRRLLPANIRCVQA